MTGSIWSTAPWFVPIHRPRAQKGGGAHWEAFSRSRGGFTSRVHVRCDNQGYPPGFVLTGGQVSDYKATGALMAFPAPNPRAMLADRGYDSYSFRQDLLLHGILSVIPSRKGRSTPQKTDWRCYRDRNRIERMFNRLKQFRRIATRYNKTDLSLMSFLSLAAARLWIRSFINAA
ncbi:IS5 family transposase [Gluconobacter wancherniae]|uniref:IS5 family transposase n=1 Tax=Gluconobacter wancherniae TaxID=1307955 RepID=UPI001B8B7CEE|nr:IS5 family transposase [Gluconobacter wancherniae]MBS1089287.1 IS5 family transposase [Gluconobacter wancherniae]